MKSKLFFFANERDSRILKVIDRIFGIMLILLAMFSSLLGIHSFLEEKLGVGETWGSVVVGLGVIMLMTIEQIITYYIDRRISNK